MSKRSERSSSSGSAEKPTPKRKKQKDKEMEETDSLISMEILLDKLTAIESRMEDNFSNLHTQIAELSNEFKF